MTQTKPTVDHESERLVISYLLSADEKDGAEAVFAGLVERDFDGMTNRIVMRGIQHVVAEGIALTVGSVADALHEIGFAQPKHADLLRLTLETPAAHGTAVAAKRRLIELRRWRTLLELGDNFRTAYERGGATVDQLIQQSLVDFDALVADGGKSEVLNFGEVMRERVAEIRRAEGKPLRRVRTGCEIVDGLVGGFGESDLVVLAAATAGGKTAFAGHVFESMARGGHNVLVASAEMQAWELADRTLSRTSHVPAIAIRDGKLDWEQVASLERTAQGDEWGRVFVLERNGSLTVQRIAQVARQVQRRSGLGLVVVDYLQLISAVGTSGDRGRTREAEVASVVRGLKNVAMDMRVPVLALSQFNREGAKNGEPELHHLRESGEIEQACNMALFLWQDEPKSDLRTLACKKNRSGPANLAAQIRWHSSNLSFSLVRQ